MAKGFIKNLLLVSISLQLVSLGVLSPARAGATASLSLSPTQGTFIVGNTFDISIFVNTNDNDINTVETNIKFTPETIQIVSPSAGQSLISMWVTQPTFSNEQGTIYFAGGIPSPGINTTAGLISTITFRAKAPGEAKIEILPASKVLLNDGKGTNILSSVAKGSYLLTLPAPGGPEISSPTHPDQNAWSRNNNLTFSWKREEGVKEFSWWLDEDAHGYADNKPDGTGTSASYSDVKSGLWYFHVKGKTDESWGQQSTYAVHIDNTAPATFTPSTESTISRPDERRIVTFATTDRHSGLDHYEVKILPLDEDSNAAEPFFTEHTSPWLTPTLGIGRLAIIVRAYDKAGNWIDGTVNILNEPPPPTLTTRLTGGIIINGRFVPWWLIIVVAIVALLILLLALVIWRRVHRDVATELHETLAKAHRRIQEQRREITAELKEEAVVKDLLGRELGELGSKEGENSPPRPPLV